MPLKKGQSKEVIAENIQTEMQHNKKKKQAVAIALALAFGAAQQKRGQYNKKAK